MYSSTFNKTYNDFFFEKINNAIPYRNKSMTPASLHPLFQILFGEKYLITKENKVVDGKKIYEKGNIKVYEKDHVLPIGYATSHFIKESFFEKLQYPNTIFPLLGSVFQEEGEEPFLLEKENLLYEIDKQENVKLEKKKDGYKVIAKKGGILRLKIDKKYPTIDWLNIADIVITDYSAIVYEAALLNKKIILYAYDLGNYEINRDFYLNYRKDMVGILAPTTKDIVQALEMKGHDRERTEIFSKKYVDYHGQNCTKKLANLILKLKRNG